MRVEVNGTPFELGETEATPTIGITDYSRRVTDDFGVTTVVKRGFSRRLSVRLAVPMTGVDALQRRLADLRATSAVWVADNTSEWLSVEGFYKDFSIDLASAGFSNCTLTVEGIAQTEVVADTGGDPAPVGMISSLQLLQPVPVTDAVLVSSTVPETDYAAWSAATSYPKGARVLKASTHRIYESAIGGNLNHDPAAETGEWFDVGPTNRWAMFDQALGTATTTGSPLVVVLNLTGVNAIALLDIIGPTVRVQANGFDRTIAVNNGAAVFLDMPMTTGNVTVTIGPSGVAVGTLLAGRVVSLGVTETSASAGITDYSRKNTDDFGEVTIVERAWSKRMSAKSLIRTDAIDLVANRIAAVRGTPALWIGDVETDALTIYGFFKDFSIERDENVSKLSLSIEGLSKAAPLPVPAVVYVLRGDYDPTVSYAAGNVVQYEGSSWFYTADAASTGNAPPALPQTENAYWKVFARAGFDGAPGDGGNSTFLHIAYANSPNGSVDFTTGAPGLRTYLGIRVDGAQADSTNYADYNWSLIKGADGLNGSNGTPGAPGANGLPTYVHIAYANDATGTSNFSVDDPTGRTYIGFYTDQTVADSTNPALYAWSLIKGADGLNGTNGAPGAPGANGQTSYFHTAYANSPTGSIDFTTGVPGGRAFIGTYSDFSPADSNDPNVYTWSAYKGPPSFGLAARGDVIVAGNSLVKTATNGAWNSGGGFSTEGFNAGAQTSFGFENATQMMAGLNTDPATNDSYDSIDYAIFILGNTSQVYESGVFIGDIGAWATSTRFAIVYDNKTVTYYKDGNSVRQIPVAAGQTLYFDAALAGNAAGKVKDIAFLAAGTAGTDGADGSNGVSPITVSAQPEAIQINLDGSGVPQNLPLAVGNIAMKGGAAIPVTSVTIVSVAGVTTAVSGSSINITATSGGVDGEIIYNVVAGGQTVRKRIGVTISRSGGDGAVSTTVNITTPQLSWTSYQQHGGTLAINASSTGKINVNLTGAIRAGLGGYLRFYSKLQYRVAAGTWTDVPGSERLSTVSEMVFEPDRQLAADVNGAGPYSLTGLTNSGAYEARVMTYKVSGSDNSATVALNLNGKQVA